MRQLASQAGSSPTPAAVAPPSPEDAALPTADDGTAAAPPCLNGGREMGPSQSAAAALPAAGVVEVTAASEVATPSGDARVGAASTNATTAGVDAQKEGGGATIVEH
jgi:hypothetical protein